ncbi:hypothetical protein [Vibrio alginolyticus]|uniref:hypothetical protein n=1 Tax=Vibrio alginolyticus TaxID=663 RepID=UPI0006CA7252|nr:hypothetical protein [Vibrio alginolyticus]KPM98336.1 hypothetical protein AOG25_07770 [Vibrio alginolyticus]
MANEQSFTLTLTGLTLEQAKAIAEAHGVSPEWDRKETADDTTVCSSSDENKVEALIYPDNPLPCKQGDEVHVVWDHDNKETLPAGYIGYMFAGDAMRHVVMDRGSVCFKGENQFTYGGISDYFEFRRKKDNGEI